MVLWSLVVLWSGTIGGSVRGSGITPMSVTDCDVRGVLREKDFSRSCGLDVCMIHRRLRCVRPAVTLCNVGTSLCTKGCTKPESLCAGSDLATLTCLPVRVFVVCVGILAWFSGGTAERPSGLRERAESQTGVLILLVIMLFIDIVSCFKMLFSYCYRVIPSSFHYS
jgi:hypothetical protein